MTAEEINLAAETADKSSAGLPLSKYLSYVPDVGGGGWFAVALTDVPYGIFVGWDKAGNPRVSHEEPPGDTRYFQVNDDGTIGQLIVDDN